MKEDLELPQEDLRARFYEYYHKVYDEKFTKRFWKYKEDLGTTIWGVSRSRRPDACVLTRMTGSSF